MCCVSHLWPLLKHTHQRKLIVGKYVSDVRQLEYVEHLIKI